MTFDSEAEAQRLALRARITTTHGSVHNFCRTAGQALPRATVYQALSGRYPGNLARQLARIEAALGTPPTTADDTTGMEAIQAALTAAACARCYVSQSQPRCQRCNGLFEAQALAVFGLLQGGPNANADG